jgi:hypothetical protein
MENSGIIRIKFAISEINLYTLREIRRKSKNIASECVYFTERLLRHDIDGEGAEMVPVKCKAIQPKDIVDIWWDAVRSEDDNEKFRLPQYIPLTFIQTNDILSKLYFETDNNLGFEVLFEQFTPELRKLGDIPTIKGKLTKLYDQIVSASVKDGLDTLYDNVNASKSVK